MSETAFSFLTAGRIEFGRGVSDQAGQLALGFGTRVLVVRGRSVPFVNDLRGALWRLGANVEEVFRAGEPTLEALQTGLDVGRTLQADVILAVGGGAVIDLGKAIAALLPGSGAVMDHLEGVGGAQPLTCAPLPMIAIPTTSGTGAEVTKNAVITVLEAGRKVSLRDPRMVPDVALIDPALTDHTPRAQTLASGLDALTQVIEPYVSHRANPLTDALCRAAIPKGARALARLAAAEDPQARDDMAFVSLAGGLALANAGLGAVHGLAGVLGGRLGAPHGLICGRLLGPVMAANAASLRAAGGASERFQEVAGWVGQGFDQDPNGIFERLPDLLDDWQVQRLSHWLTPEIDLMQIAEEAAGASSMKANPCVLLASDLVGIMQQAM
ncbi:iron-containing alcohol dehydrogenase [uncultured Roseobacter sp.]|uniref:iron-containing alcohol dehydrogenase n=1 Tax=uncultured Roseobacter sp. TaxID=114847 RepID=UPI002625A7CE|nr:iron-containing alcohol dehydrogenase [uncultured Roseobacter sp.]